MFSVIAAFTRWWCININKLTPADADEEYFKVTNYISHKGSELKRQMRKEELQTAALGTSMQIYLYLNNTFFLTPTRKVRTFLPNARGRSEYYPP